MGTLLMGAFKGDGESVQVVINGRGELGQLTAVADTRGNVKGFAANPACDPPLKPTGKLDVGGAVGPGVVTVVRSHASWKEPYTGMVAVQSGEVAEDLAHYMVDSEQTNTALGLGVSINKAGLVRAAGGFMVQVLPNCSEETLSHLEANIGALPSVSVLAERESARSLVELVLAGIGTGPFTDAIEPQFGPCSVENLRPRMLRAIGSLGADDVRTLLDEQGGTIEVRCEFCAEVVHFQEDDLQILLVSDTVAP
eukprot:SM000485S16495  [mRNA]  locus=s485:6689:8442:- [translate_table: standard]